MERIMDGMNGGMETAAPMSEMGTTDGDEGAAKPRPKRTSRPKARATAARPKAAKKARKTGGKKRAKKTTKGATKARKTTGRKRAKKRARR